MQAILAWQNWIINEISCLLVSRLLLLQLLLEYWLPKKLVMSVMWKVDLIL